jgi:adenine-specific DNA-methyltransferase
MEKLDKSEGQSMDIVADNIAKLKELFPEILTENKIDFNTLKALLGEEIEVDDERYSFNWNGKAQARRLAQSPSTGTLRPSKEDSVDWDTTQNLFIEGDNLEVLKLLQKSYHKRVKMIYIDPPYNTGNDFVYPDDFKDNIQNYLELTGQVESGRKIGTNTESSGRYHSDWLNMMYPRLKLARNLLKEDGIFVTSINECEVGNLRKICDELFGEENFLVDFPRKTKSTNNHDKNGLNIQHENTLIYSKNKSIVTLIGDDKDLSKYKNPDSDSNGPWVSDNPSANLDGRNTKNDFQIVNPKTGQVDIPPEGRHWAFSVKSLPELVANGRVKFKDSIKDGERGFIYKRYLNDLGDMFSKVDSLYFCNNEYMNQVATRELRDILGAAVFDYAKPVSFLKKIIKFSAGKDDIVLDFFAGSSSTANAVLELNAVENLEMKFIMVQVPEVISNPNVTSKGFKNVVDISKARIRASAINVKQDNPSYQGDLGFKVFKLDSSNLKPWDADFDSLAQDLAEATEVVKAERCAEDVLFEILLKYGLDLTLPIETHTLEGKTVYEVGAGALVVCLDSGITEAVAEAIGKLKETLEPEVMRVVFKDSGFANDAAKVNAVQVLKQFGIDDVKSI